MKTFTSFAKEIGKCGTTIKRYAVEKEWLKDGVHYFKKHNINKPIFVITPEGEQVIKDILAGKKKERLCRGKNIGYEKFGRCR